MTCRDSIFFLCEPCQMMDFNTFIVIVLLASQRLFLTNNNPQQINSLSFTPFYGTPLNKVQTSALTNLRNRLFPAVKLNLVINSSTQS